MVGPNPLGCPLGYSLYSSGHRAYMLQSYFVKIIWPANEERLVHWTIWPMTVWPRDSKGISLSTQYLWDIFASCTFLARQHYGDVMISSMTSKITSLTIVYSTIYSGLDQRKYLSSASLAFVRGNNRSPVNIWWRHHGNSPLSNSSMDRELLHTHFHSLLHGHY